MTDINLLLWIGAPVLLIGTGALWYFFGKRLGGIGMVAGLILYAMLQFKKNIQLQEKVRKNEKDIKAVSGANNDRLKSRDDSRSGKLREDDGFRRD